MIINDSSLKRRYAEIIARAKATPKDGQWHNIGTWPHNDFILMALCLAGYEASELETSPPQYRVKYIEITYDFGDDKGPVPAHRHINADGSFGGWVAQTAVVAKNCYLGPDVRVYGNARVLNDTRLYNNVQVYGNAWLSGGVVVHDSTEIFGNAQIRSNVYIAGLSKISGNVKIEGAYGIYDIVATDKRQILYGLMRGYPWVCYPMNDKTICLKFGCEVKPLDYWEKNLEEILDHSPAERKPHHEALLGLFNLIKVAIELPS